MKELSSILWKVHWATSDRILSQVSVYLHDNSSQQFWDNLRDCVGQETLVHVTICIFDSVIHGGKAKCAQNTYQVQKLQLTCYDHDRLTGTAAIQYFAERFVGHDGRRCRRKVGSCRSTLMRQSYGLARLCRYVQCYT